MISVIIPNYNRSHYLEQALQSVCGQSYQNWEVLVVDDGSTDQSKELIDTFVNKDSRIHCIERTIEPKGAATCRNMGIESAKGDYIIFLDSDDVLAPHCLKQRADVMEQQPNLDFTVFKMQFFKEKPGDDPRLWNLETNEPVLDRFLNLDAVWQTSGPIWKLSALKKIGGFNPELACWQDIDIHLKALFAELNYKICYHLPIDCYYRKNSELSISQSSTNSLKKLQSKRMIYEWMSPLANKAHYQPWPMAVNIMASALHGYQFKFFWKFYSDEKHQLPPDIRKNLLKMASIKLFRLYKMPYFDSKYKELSAKTVKESSIGRFSADSMDLNKEQ